MGGLPARKRGIARHLTPPLRLAAGTHPSDEPFARAQLQRLRGLLEGAEALGGVQMPDGCGDPALRPRGHRQIDVGEGPACIGTEAVHGILQGHRTAGRLVGSPRHILDQGQEGGAFLDALVEGGRELPQRCLGRGDGLTGHHLGGDVAEITDDAEATFGKGNAVNPPLVVFGGLTVKALLKAFGGNISVPGFERVAEALNNFIGIALGPQAVDHLVEVAANQTGNISENRKGRGIDLAEAKVGVDDVNAERSVLEQRLELSGTLAQGRLGVFALGNVVRLRGAHNATGACP